MLAPLLEANPRSSLGWIAAGTLREQLTDYAGAAAAYERALEIDPKAPAARYHRAFLRLRDGDFGPGWADYEHRFDACATTRPPLPAPRWSGAPVGSLVVVAEQGLGDVIHFARFIAATRAILRRDR